MKHFCGTNASELVWEKSFWQRAEVQAALEKVVARPARYPVVHRETRRVLVHRFPYGIFYRVYGERVVVVACMHGRRDPRRWRPQR